MLPASVARPLVRHRALGTSTVLDDAPHGMCHSMGGKPMAIVKNFFESIGALALLFVVFLVATFPVTWLLMLFLGNVGAALSYWAVLPLGVVVSLLIGAGSSGGYKY